MNALPKPTLADIARQAGVSPSTVSMILSGRVGVSFSEETVSRVRASAKALDYKTTGDKKRPARVFDRRMVLIVCPNVLNPYYSTLVQSIEQAAHAKKYSTLIYNTYRDVETETRGLGTFAATDLAGIIFTMMPQATDLIEQINKTIPVVVIGDRNTSVSIDTVEMDNYSAGVLIARHMIQLGHRHIAYISTTLNESNSARTRRLDGVRETYAQECPHGSVLVKSRDISPETDLNNLLIEQAVGNELTRECLSNKKITAFVAVNDMVAYGVLDALQSGGFRVPQDYSVCGFDNIFPSQFSSVKLTTVEHYIADKGRNSFEILYSKITGAASSRNITRVEYQHHLIIRDSTAPPR